MAEAFLLKKFLLKWDASQGVTLFVISCRQEFEHFQVHTPASSECQMNLYTPAVVAAGLSPDFVEFLHSSCLNGESRESSA